MNNEFISVFLVTTVPHTRKTQSLLGIRPLDCRRSGPDVACWTSDHWVSGSKPLGYDIREADTPYHASIPCVIIVLFTFTLGKLISDPVVFILYNVLNSPPLDNYKSRKCVHLGVTLWGP